MAIEKQATRPPLVAIRGKPVRLPWTRGVWATVAICLAVVALTGEFVIVPKTAAPLRPFVVSGWAYPQDARQAVDTAVAGRTQTAVPIRFEQRQGFEFDIYNFSNLSQRILGLQQPEYAPTGGGAKLELEIGTTGKSYGAGDPGTTTFAPQVTIPPHQDRWVRVTWISKRCMAAGGSAAFEYLWLRVKVGSITRVETVELPMDFAIAVPRDATDAGADC